MYILKWLFNNWEIISIQWNQVDETGDCDTVDSLSPRDMNINFNLSQNRTQSRQKIKNKNTSYAPKIAKSNSFPSAPNPSIGQAASSPRRNRSKNLGIGTSAGKRSPRPLSNSQSLHHLLRSQVQSVIARYHTDFSALFTTFFLRLPSLFPPIFFFFSFFIPVIHRLSIEFQCPYNYISSLFLQMS